MGLDTNHLSDNIPIEKLEQVMLSSKSYTEAQEKLKISPRYLRKLISKHNISVSHFKRNVSSNTKQNITKGELLKAISDKSH